MTDREQRRAYEESAQTLQDRFGITGDDVAANPASPAQGQVGHTPFRLDPRCKRRCTSPNRSAGDSPAKTGQERGTGRKVVYCPCCERELHRAPESVEGSVIQTPANLNPALMAGKATRFVDPICQYDTWLLFDVKERR